MKKLICGQINCELAASCLVIWVFGNLGINGIIGIGATLLDIVSSRFGVNAFGRLQVIGSLVSLVKSALEILALVKYSRKAAEVISSKAAEITKVIEIKKPLSCSFACLDKSERSFLFYWS